MAMTQPKDLAEAIGLGIGKWREVAAGVRRDRGTKDCALCAMFLAVGCVGCPVMVHTGQPGCDGAPYEDEWRPLVDADGSAYADTPQKKAAAQSVLDFLLMLDRTHTPGLS
jgi:hypothetical protein